MPWSPGDADKHKKGLSNSSKERWASIANSVLRDTGDEGKAIKVANGLTRESIKRRLMKGRTGIGGFDG